ncbi:MAG: hypothetical protein E1N59_2758 [Puniceicoccaceae bacterium 5H]|nr:MAG: hypothetical protein E1N59_2758 [Puniceicoccaceae bacterium 5H]
MTPLLAFDVGEFLPAIFVILWVIIQIFNASRKSSEEEENSSRPPQESEWAAAKRRMQERKDASVGEARRLQEELRRRYAERHYEDTGRVAPPPLPAEQREEPHYDPFRSDQDQQRPQPQPRPVPQPAYERPEPEPYERPEPKPLRGFMDQHTEPQRAPAESVSNPVEDMMARVREQQRKAQEAERQRKAAHERAQEIMRKGQQSASRYGKSRAVPVGDGWGLGDLPVDDALHQILHDPLAVQKGIVLAEIFGQPVSMRESTTDLPR